MKYCRVDGCQIYGQFQIFEDSWRLSRPFYRMTFNTDTSFLSAVIHQVGAIGISPKNYRETERRM
jgi:hypothetical protein